MTGTRFALHAAVLTTVIAAVAWPAAPALAGPLPLEDAWAELDGPQPRGPGDGIILRHSPLNTGGPASDSDFIDPAGSANAWQYLADDIRLTNPATVRRIAWWGFYHLDNPPPNEVFQIRILGADSVTGLPNESTIVRAELHMDVTRAATGRTVFTSIDPPEYRFQVDLASPLTLEANTTYWLEVSQVGAHDSLFRWLVATVPGNGRVFRSYQFPDWSFSGGGDLSFELSSIPEPATLVLLLTAILAIVRRRPTDRKVVQ